MGGRGDADVVADAVSVSVDRWSYTDAVRGYNPLTSFYDKSYGDPLNKVVLGGATRDAVRDRLIRTITWTLCGVTTKRAMPKTRSM